ncbi:hypothetical protein QE375_001630 [Microbacterium foliorum]|uniref:HTH cro/C1-type domain-containing protein n=1 Tax=Microbacterium foliorum TaxID=104336 RepID=A0ABU1HQG4_9MICO|nr:hypothetical protein [Microbacterium foliorum]MDR6142076.1 hypothetical protein [Microbacterium foliorum]
MENQAVEQRATEFVHRLADEVRVELVRQRRSARDLAAALGISEHTVGRRLNGSKPFNTFELVLVSSFLGLSYTALTERASSDLAAVAS